MSRKTKYYPTQTHYCLPLSDEEWARLNHIDARGNDRTDIIPALKKAGAIGRHVEWSGHFGRNIFFAVENTRQAARVVAVIKKLLKS